MNPILVAALAAGDVAVDRDERLAGVAFALPAVVKIFPAVFGVWLLRLRRWRAAGAAIGTGVATVGASLLVFGVDAHRAYLAEALLPRRRTAAFAGGLPPDAPYLTIRRPLSVTFPELDPAMLSLIAAVVLAPVAAYLLAVEVDGSRAAESAAPGRLVALHGTLAATILFFSSYQTYFVFLVVTLVPLLYRLPPVARGRYSSPGRS